MSNPFDGPNDYSGSEWSRPRDAEWQSANAQWNAPGNQHNVNPAPMMAPPPPQQPQYEQYQQYGSGKRSSAGAIVAGILGGLLVLGLIVVGGIFALRSVDSSWFGGGSSVATVMETVTEHAPAEGEVAEKEEAATSKMKEPTPTTSKAKDVSLSDVTVSGPTSMPFAYQVQSDVIAYYNSHGKIPSYVDSYSSVTGETYRMTCTQYQTYVHCYGGNNANVYLR